MYNHYRCRDEKWIAVAHLQPDRYWPLFCKAMEIPELENDPRFNSLEARGKNSKELIRILDEKFAGKTRDEWIAQLKKGGCICTPIQTPMEVSRDPQAFANNYFIEVDHPDDGTRPEWSGCPGISAKHRLRGESRHPDSAQHTEEILRGTRIHARKKSPN